MEIMNGELHNWLQLIFRWVHVVASILWLGLLYFFVLIQAHATRNIDEAGRRAAIPQIVPCALYWFRWAAAWTWISGFLLAILMYYLRGGLFEEPDGNPWLWLAIYLATLAVSLVLYQAIMTRVTRPILANALALLLFFGIYLLLSLIHI